MIPNLFQAVSLQQKIVARLPDISLSKQLTCSHFGENASKAESCCTMKPKLGSSECDCWTRSMLEEECCFSSHGEVSVVKHVPALPLVLRGRMTSCTFFRGLGTASWKKFIFG